MAGPRPRPSGRLATLACALATLALGGGCGGAESAPRAEAAQAVAFESPAPLPGPREEAVLVIRDLGELRFELLAEKAPKTVEHFKELAAAGFFDGTTFHRVIPDFMIQGGDPNTRDRDPRNDGKGGPGHNIEDEISDVSHVRGIVSMANSGPNTNGSQFFIVTADACSWLDGKHTVFGRVTAGMDVVDAISGVATGPGDRPRDDVRIESVTVADD